MLVLLPPSETKGDGGDESAPLDLSSLAFSALTPERSRAISALKKLSRSVGESTTALGLGPTQRFEIDRNRSLAISPTMPAVERYTGVLFDGLDTGSLGAASRSWLGSTVAIHSALFGIVRADDPIPAYRLSHDSKLPGLRLRELWATSIARELAASNKFVLDLRSEAYVHFGPAPSNSVFLRVVTESAGGQRRALNHFNKKGKGEFVRAMAEDAVEARNAADVVDWAASRGVRVERQREGELHLVL